MNVTETPIIPYDENRYYIYGSNKAFVSIVGDVVGPIFPTMPVNATSLLNLPMVSVQRLELSLALSRRLLLSVLWYMFIDATEGHTSFVFGS